MVRPVVGKAGQAMAKSASSASNRASATGPMLPMSVESKVEQYLKKICRVPRPLSQARAASDSVTASCTGQVRDFKATTTASASPRSFRLAPEGTPLTCTVRMPFLTRVLARSVAPVKSSAMHPNTMDMGVASPRWRPLPGGRGCFCL